MKRGQQIKIKMSKIEKIKNLNKIKIKPTREEVKEAVKTLIKWAGDDPDREGLIFLLVIIMIQEKFYQKNFKKLMVTMK